MLRAIILSVFVLFGCSATQTAMNATQKINHVFDAVDSRADDIITQVDSETPDPKEIRESAEDIKNITSNGREQTSTIQKQIPKMEDKVPVWLQVLYLFGILGILFLVWLLLERTGIIQVIKSFFWGLGKLIPKDSQVEAKLIEEVESGEKTPQELKQYFRTKYPDINAALNKRKRDGKSTSTPGSRSSLPQSSVVAVPRGQSGSTSGQSSSER